MRSRAVLVSVTLVGLAAQPRTQERHGPWEPATVAAAEAAVARLGATVSSHLSGSVITIPGLASSTGATALIASVEEVKRALRDIGATETPISVEVDLPGDVLFDFDQSAIRSEAVPVLGRVATVLSSYAHSQVLIEGHTDAKGSSSSNQTLSVRRAVAVRRWLESRGLKNLQITTKGLGASQPVAPNANSDGSDNPEGRRKNRRVRIVITKPPKAY